MPPVPLYCMNFLIREEHDTNMKYPKQGLFICLGDKPVQIQQNKISAKSAIKILISDVLQEGFQFILETFCICWGQTQCSNNHR